MANWKYKAAIGVLSVVTAFNTVHTLMEMNSSADNEKMAFELPEGFQDLTVQDLRDGMTMPHYFKIAGIAEAMAQDGIELPANLDLRVRYAERLSEAKYAQYDDNNLMQIAFDMSRSEGAVEVRDGEWDVDLLESYVDRVMDMDQRIVKAADAATAFLRDEGLSQTDAESYVRQSIGLAYVDFLQPGRASVDGLGVDSRLNIKTAEHTDLISDVHQQMHGFLQRRLEDLDVADEVFSYTPPKVAEEEVVQYMDALNENAVVEQIPFDPNTYILPVYSESDDVDFDPYADEDFTTGPHAAPGAIFDDVIVQDPYAPKPTFEYVDNQIPDGYPTFKLPEDDEEDKLEM
jgi:hypothetical protein